MLAEADAPLILADGTKINPVDGKVIRESLPTQKYIEVPKASVAQSLIVKTRRTVAELPSPPAQLTGVALIAFYTLFGLPDSEIAIACVGKISVEQIKQIRELDAYKDFMESASANINATAQSTVRDIFQQHAAQAATNIVEAANEGGVLGFKASQDILDRAGHRPVDIVEHKHSMEGGLNIVITKRDESKQAPVIEVDYENIS